MDLSTTGLCLSANAAIDLHLHTTYSDARWTPELLLDHLSHAQFGLAAITDHDRPDTVAAIQQLALEKHLPVLVGAEMSSSWKGELVDLLCFGFDPNPKALTDLAQDLLRRQQENTREVYETLQRQGYTLPPEALSTILSESGMQQPHTLVALLKENGYGLGEPSAGRLMLDAGFAFTTNDPAAIVEAAHQNGGVCLLAHPGRGDGFVNYDTQLIDQFRQEAPIDGLEVYYPLHTAPQTAMYQEYARRHHLLVSAGSDSHNQDKLPIKYQAGLCRDLLERVGIRIE
ncbi:MAG: PHP domain-containing protein [Anaerolineae bacterium]|nr:PHP domain-containing protein [Anaerolineae bacterium]